MFTNIAIIITLLTATFLNLFILDNIIGYVAPIELLLFSISLLIIAWCLIETVNRMR